MAERSRSLLSMTLDINTETTALRDILGAYVGLEKLMQRSGIEDDPELPMNRAELHGLLRLMNGGLHRQIELIEDTVCTAVLALRTDPPLPAGT